jgi:hypothetical protein
MAKHLNNDEVKNIANLIRDWSKEKLTWNNLCRKCEELFGVTATRQTLFAHRKIREAYSARKRHISRNGVRTPAPSSLAFAAGRLARQEALIEELQEKNSRLLEQFVKWQYNAYKRGISIDELNDALPRIDRERTDGKTSTELGHERKARRS